MSETCPFCEPGTRVVIRNLHALMLWDAFPVSDGHALIIPQRHIAHPWDLTVPEVQDLYALLGQAREMIDRRWQPAGYNIGVNVGVAAGQTIFHLHVHLIPRYAGDHPSPRGGVRRVRAPQVRWVEEPEH